MSGLFSINGIGDGEIGMEFLFIRLLLNLAVVVGIVRFLYFPFNQKRSFQFTYFIISNVVFFLCFILEKSELNLGLALGLFAIFGIIRYRTDPIPIKEMTYLFLVIGLSVINALYDASSSIIGLLFINAFSLGLTLLMEKLWKTREIHVVNIVYDQLELLHKDKRSELITDLEERTGLTVTDISIGKVDFSLNSARLQVTVKGDQHIRPS